MIVVVLMLAFGLPGWEEEDSPKEAISMAEKANPDLVDSDVTLTNMTPSEETAGMEKVPLAAEADMAEV